MKRLLRPGVFIGCVSLIAFGCDLKESDPMALAEAGTPEVDVEAPEAGGPEGGCRASIAELRASFGGNYCPAEFMAGTSSISCRPSPPRSIETWVCEGLQVLEIDWNDRTTCYYEPTGRLVGIMHWAHTEIHCGGKSGTITAGRTPYCGFSPPGVRTLSCTGRDGGVDGSADAR